MTALSQIPECPSQVLDAPHATRAGCQMSPALRSSQALSPQEIAR